MSSNGERNSRDYAREAEATRRRISRTMDEVTDRLTVGQVLDEVLGYAKGGGGTLATALTRAARDNPVPSLLVSAGAMMFLSERLGLPRRTASRSASSMGAMAGKSGAGLKQGLSDATNAAGDAFSSAGEQVGNLGRQARNRAASAAQSAGETVQDISGAVADQVTALAAQAQEQLETASSQLIQQARRLMQEQPLLAGAIGLAIGAGIAAALPKTTTEQEVMGDASKAVKDAAAELAEEGYETAKDVVGRVSEAAVKAAEEEGLTGEAVSDLTGSAAEKITKVVQAAKEEATSHRPRRANHF